MTESVNRQQFLDQCVEMFATGSLEAETENLRSFLLSPTGMKMLGLLQREAGYVSAIRAIGVSTLDPHVCVAELSAIKGSAQGIYRMIDTLLEISNV